MENIGTNISFRDIICACADYNAEFITTTETRYVKIVPFHIDIYCKLIIELKVVLAEKCLVTFMIQIALGN